MRNLSYFNEKLEKATFVLLPHSMHKYALLVVYLFSFSLSPFDKMKVPLLRCQRGSLTASLSLFDDLKEA